MKTSRFLALNLACCLFPMTLGYAVSPSPSSTPNSTPVQPVAPVSSVASASQYQELARQTEANLQTQILNQWFPRAVDGKVGGFDQNFSENWTPDGTDTRSIVYQSRLTWLAAQAALRYPEKRPTWLVYSNHGAKFLKDAMWDKADGGFFWALDDAKTPARNGEKHAYGIAFAIYALSANYQVSGDKSSLETAQRAFRWLEKYAHDAKNGGYYEAFTRSGRPILAPVASEQTTDVIGTRYGCKSMNTHIHLLEALSALHEVWPDKTVESRLRELFKLTRDTIVVSPPGAMHLYFRPDWKPIPDHDSFGHDIETAYLLVEAAGALKMKDDPRTWEVAKSLVDHTLDFGNDAENGGFYDAGGTFGGITNAEKVWWVQAEALNALLLMHEKYGAQTPRYWNEFLRQWDFIQTRQIDSQNGGWYSTVTREGAPIAGRAKSDGWTEGYHQGRALLNVSVTLARLAKR